MTDWKEYTWRDLVTLEYGKSLSDYKGAEGPIPVFGTNGPIGFTTKALCNYSSVVIGRKGAYRGVHYSDKPFFVIDTAFYIKPKIKDLDLKYCYFNLKTVDINGMDSGSAIPSTSRDDFYNLPITLPPLATQTAIAEILSSLDDKIELNNQINRELEALAQALFKQWFVDFEFPDAEGVPYKSSGGEMVESALGEIPLGWRVGTLSQFAFLSKESVKPFEKPENIFYHYSLPEFDAGKSPGKEFGERIMSSKYRVFPFSILVSKLNPRIPRIWTIIDCVENSICSTEFQVVRGENDSIFGYIYGVCTSEHFTKSLQSRVTGTSSSHQRVNPRDIINYELVEPPTIYMKNFNFIIMGFLELIEKNINENISLSTLRDALLPKLISGEVKVSVL